VPHHTLSWIVGACVSARWAGRAHAITGDGASKWIRASLVAANWLYQHTSSAGNCVWWLCLCVHSTWPCSFGMDTALVWCHLVPGLPCACLHSPIGSLWSASHNHRLECGLGGRLLFHQQRRPLSVLLSFDNYCIRLLEFPSIQFFVRLHLWMLMIWFNVFSFQCPNI
jgi:hypothetical protein